MCSYSLRKGNKHVVHNAKYNIHYQITFLILQQIKLGLSDIHAVCVFPPINF
jgi:hypothetical protein